MLGRLHRRLTLAGVGAAALLVGARPTSAAPAQRPTVTFVRFAPGLGHPYLYSVALAQGAPRRVQLPVAAAAAPAWSRDGRRLVFAGGTNAPGRPDIVGPSHLWATRPDGSRAHPLTRGSVRDGAAAWSPDGRRIVFVRAALTGNRSALWMVDADGRRARRLTWGGIDLEPSWTPDGRAIAFVRIDPTTFQSGIWLVSPDGSRRRRILSRLRGLTDPVWSPDGTRLLVEDGRALYSVRPAGGTLRLLARLGTDARGAVEDPDPAWSPDGKLVVFCQLRSGEVDRSDIWVVRANGGGARRVTRSPGLDTDPAWRP